MSLRILPSIAAITILSWALTGCTVVPTPTVLAEKPHVTEKKPGNGLKLCVIVRDERPEVIRKLNISGLTRTTIFMIPTSVAFLAHPEPLDAIVAHHAKASLEHAGYTVIRSYPTAPVALSDKKRTEDDYNKLPQADRDAAWALRDSQNDEQLKKAKSNIAALGDTAVTAWGPGVDTTGCDAVIDIRIRSFWTDYNYWGSFSWMSANVALCKPADANRTVLFGKSATGVGYCFTPLTPLTPGLDIPVSMNTSYWFVMNSFEEIVASPDFTRQLTSK